MDKSDNIQKITSERYGDHVIERYIEIHEPVMFHFGDSSGEITIHEKTIFDPLPKPKVKLKPWEEEELKKQIEAMDFFDNISKRNKLIKYSKLPSHIQGVLLFAFKNRIRTKGIITIGQTFQQYCKKEFKVETSK